MFTKNKFQKVVSSVFIVSILLSSFQAPTVSAQSRDGLKRQVNAETGKVSFIGPETGRALAASKALGTFLHPQDPGMALAMRYAPEFGIQNPERDLSLMKQNKSDDGRVTVRYQQKYQNIPVMGGELMVNTNANGDLYSMNGEVSPNLSLPTRPTIDAKQATQTALQEMAKWYQKQPSDFVASTLQLWIYDESLLQSSTRPAELVWRMEVTAKDNAMPVRELVLVNAQRGSISLHFNQIDNEWSATPINKTAQSSNATSVNLSSTPEISSGEPTVTQITTDHMLALSSGATWYVATTGNDSNDCATISTPCATTNGAIGKAASGDTLEVSVGLYQGSAALVNVTKSIVMLGGWNSDFSSQSGFSILDGTGNTPAPLLIQVKQSATIERFILKNAGGGINISNGSTCPNPITLTLRQSSITGIASSNGAVTAAIMNCGTLLLENSTISNNQGIGIENFTGTVVIKNSTITQNSSANWGQFVGGGIETTQGIGSVTIQNTILAANTGYGNTPQDCSGGIASSGNNIIGTTTYCYPTLQPNDIIGIDPKLGPQLPNGYFPLLSNSPAIDSGDPAACASTDQRGISRPQGNACDIGAYEYAIPGNVASLAIVGGNDQRTAPNYVFHLPLSVAPLDNQDNLVPNVTVNFSAPGSGANAKFADTGNTSTLVISNSNGLAITSTLTANGQSGIYNVTASTNGVTLVNFNLQNSGLYVATTGNDANSCTVAASPCATINGAINKAVSEDVILVASGTYTGTADEVVLINKSITLAGGWNSIFTTQNGTSIIDGQGTRRGISITYGLSSIIDRFTIQNGYNIQGGGILIASSGTTVISNSTIRNNNAGVNGSGPYGGGGIDNSGTLTINSSTVNSNKVAGDFLGSGIRNGGTLFLNNSTITGNAGGRGGIHNDGVLFINNSTITRNRPFGINNLNGKVTFQNTLIARNGPSGDCQNEPYYSGVITSQGHNLIGNGSGCSFTAATGDLIGTSANPINPNLSLLQDNGGATWTHAIMEGSPTIDAGNPVTCLSVDQRGIVRPVGSQCDIGAYEGSVLRIPSPLVETYTTKDPYILQVDLPGIFLCDENDPTCSAGDSHAKSAHTYALGTYNFYANQFNRDSMDNKGMTIISSVHYCDPYYGCPYDNAYWDGTQMVYGDAHGFPLADDVVAHELTHGVTQYESNLFEYYQSGAINESLSDVFGEYYDQTNGLGNDAANVKWLLGEDVSGLGAIRSMSNPPAFGDPDKMSSTYYYKGDGDNGGVHYNSGVNNKAAYLMVDGGTFNGKTIAALGWEKVGALYYETNTNLLTSGADYSDLYYALQQACTNLLGQHGITTGDCTQVKNALDAVEMNGQPVANFNTDAPLCGAGNPVNTYFYDDLESGISNWTFNNGAYTRWRYDSSYGAYAHSGLHSLYADDYPEAVTDATATLTPITIPSGAYLSFYHAYDFEHYASNVDPNYYDGGVLEYSINGGAWVDAGALIDYNSYKGTIYPNYINPLKGRAAFIGTSHGYISTRLNLSSLAGQLVRFRWRMGLDDLGYSLGWFVDDVRVFNCTAYTITGNAGVSGVTLSYVDGTVKTTTSQTNGDYAFKVSNHWSGTVTPSHPCYTFNPTSSIYNNVTTNQTQNYVATFNPASSCADVDVSISGNPVGSYVIPVGGRVTPIYQGLNNGPVRAVSTNGVNIITSERAYRGVSTLTDFNELMGFPANQLTTDYWFPLYDARPSFMATYLSIGNASTDNVNQPSANVSVYIGGQHMLDYVIPYGGRVTPIYPGINNGPVQVKSTNAVPIIASERAYRNVTNLTDFNEMMGLPANQLTTEYWFPLYDARPSFMATYLSIGNASTDSVNQPSANVSVYIGGQHMLDYVIPYGGRVTPIYPGINNGPVQVKSTNAVPIIASERAYRNVTNLTDFNEMMGLPANQLTTEYWFPLYDARPSFMATYLSIGNASTDSVNQPSANVSVYIGGQHMLDYVIPYGGRVTPIYPGINNGPVQVKSTNGVPIITSERAYRGVSTLTDFNELMGFPANQLTTDYWFPLIDSTSFMQTYLTIGVP